MPDRLARQVASAGNEALAAQIDEMRQARKSPQDLRFRLQAETAKRLNDGDIENAAAFIESYSRKKKQDSEWALQWALQLAGRLVRQDLQIEKAYRFVRAFKNPIWREEGFRLIAAFAARNGAAASVWKLAQQDPLPPTEHVAFLYGLVVGLKP